MANPDSRRLYALDEIQSLGYFASIHWVDTIDSTSKSLLKSIKTNSIAVPALLISDEQSSGVGRGGNVWWSPQGCLMFSMAIPMTLGPDSMDMISAELLPLRVGLSIARTLAEFSDQRIKVKWPNDVYIDGRKIAGVLIEVIASKDNLGTSIAIIGIGINCQVDFAKAPQEVRNVAASLHENVPNARRERCAPENVLVQFVHAWLTDCLRFDEDREWFHHSWNAISLLDGLWVKVQHPNGVAQGLCLGINRNGALRIQDESLQITEVLSGTVLAFRPLEDY